VIVTSARLDPAERAALEPAAAGILPKDALTRESVNAAARRALAAAAPDHSASHG
jgi:hypothetical protein